jgi:hypothetical protein
MAAACSNSGQICAANGIDTKYQSNHRRVDKGSGAYQHTFAEPLTSRRWVAVGDFRSGIAGLRAHILRRGRRMGTGRA